MNARTDLLTALAEPEAFTPLARHAARWVHERSGDPHVALAILAAAAAEEAGDACAELRELDATPMFACGPLWPTWSEWRVRLESSPWVGADGEDQPTEEGKAIVLGGDGACYLSRVWRDEQALAQAVRSRCSSAPQDARDVGGDEFSLLGELFGPGDTDQRAAVLATLDARLLLLTGPPGSGKTRTLLRALLLLRARAGKRIDVRLAAPTGKAAQRIGEALRLGKQQLRAQLGDAPARAWLDELPDEAVTLHRLLEYRPSRREFARTAQSPVGADVIAVDEASMVDLAMMRRVFEATPATALLLLAGDPDQLASVEAGSVLADLVRAGGSNSGRAVAPDGEGGKAHEPAPSVAVPRVARLLHTRRSDASLAPLFEAVRNGDATSAMSDLVERGAWHETTDLAALDRYLRAEVAPTHGAGRFDALLSAQDPALALAELSRWQCLCALRVGTFGSIAVAARIEALLGDRGVRRTRDGGFHGRAVIVEHNDYGKRLFNGDIGVVLSEPDGSARAWFPGTEGTVIQPRAFALGELPAHSSAFALTVHKAQGAEFDAVALVMPPQDARVLGRELVYTALTRARHRVDACATASVFAAALARPQARRGRLRERIRNER